jgi:sec-independent protein translocase protein TatA
MFGMGMFEVMVVGAVAVLLFGKQLPSVARNFGRTYFQFKEGLDEIQREMRQVGDTVQSSIKDPIQHSIEYEPEEPEQPSAPRFELPED